MSYNNQLPVVKQYFTNIAVVQNMAVLKQIWLLEIIRGILLMCQNTTMRVYGAWNKRYCVLCSKTYNTLHIIISLLVRDKPLEARTSVKRVYSHYQGKTASRMFHNLNEHGEISHINPFITDEANRNKTKLNKNVDISWDISYVNPDMFLNIWLSILRF